MKYYHHYYAVRVGVAWEPVSMNYFCNNFRVNATVWFFLLVRVPRLSNLPFLKVMLNDPQLATTILGNSLLGTLTLNIDYCSDLLNIVVPLSEGKAMAFAVPPYMCVCVSIHRRVCMCLCMCVIITYLYICSCICIFSCAFCFRFKWKPMRWWRMIFCIPARKAHKEFNWLILNSTVSSLKHFTWVDLHSSFKHIHIFKDPHHLLTSRSIIYYWCRTGDKMRQCHSPLNCFPNDVL